MPLEDMCLSLPTDYVHCHNWASFTFLYALTYITLLWPISTHFKGQFWLPCMLPTPDTSFSWPISTHFRGVHILPPLVPPSTLPMRLLAASDTETPYIGRLQVQHDGDWGNVCNDFFGAEEADVACMGLNYTNGAICYATSTFYPSTGI